MILKDVIKLLNEKNDVALHMMLPSGEFIPSHFHVTEVGRVQKTFVDCGGTNRESISCLIQVWVANDFEHRLTAGKLVKILNYLKYLETLPVEIEYGEEVASQYKLSNVEITPNGLLFILSGKKTECLAPDKCGVSCC